MRLPGCTAIDRSLLIVLIGLTSLTHPLAIHAADDSAALTSLRAKLREENPKLADDFDRRIKKARETINQFRKGHLIFGRVAVEGDVDPRNVIAQMTILEGGYFIGPTGQPDNPIGFRLMGYDTAVITPNGREPEEDLGSIVLKKLPEDQLSSATGRVHIEPHQNAPMMKDVRVTWGFNPDPINTPSYGYEGYTQFYRPLRVTPEADGTFLASKLSPGKYSVSVQAPNVIRVIREESLEAGKTRQTNVFELEMIRQMNVEYAVSNDFNFDEAEFKKTTLKADDRWRASDKTPQWAFDVTITQKDGNLSLKYFYAPCQIMDMGQLTFDDEIKINKTEFSRINTQTVPVLEGHVYLIHQHTWNQWILLRTTQVGQIADPDKK